MQGGQCLVACNEVCPPLELGGLGIHDLKLMGYALRITWTWLQKTDDSRSWAALSKSHEPMVTALFQASTKIVL